MREAHRALRDGTADAHAAIDALFSRFDLSRADDYAAFLSAHAQVAGPVEAAISRGDTAAIVPDWADRRRAHVLAADLAALGAPQPPLLDEPGLSSTAMVAGALYVVEGSRLGGRILARQVAADLPVGYLMHPQVAGNWRFLLARLDHVLYENASLTTAIAAARDVFARFEAAGRSWLEKA